MKRKIFVAVGLILFPALAPFFGKFYQFFFPQNTSIFIVSQEFVDIFIGLPLSYIFFLTLLFIAFGGEKKYWWLGILLIPAVMFELYFDLAHLYVPVVLGMLGWSAGAGLSRLMRKK